MLDLRPLSARSAILSVLLGLHPPELATATLVDAGRHFGFTASTLRVALTRMTAAGDLERTGTGYRLAARLVERQDRQDEALNPATTPWDGTWELLTITSTGRSPGDRAELRARLATLGLAELREGVWTRPANLARTLPDWPRDLILAFAARPADPTALARALWPLEEWAQVGTQILAAFAATTEPRQRLTLGAALVRHLRTDPALPADLLPESWNASALRAAYAAYQAELAATALDLGASR